jgi:hypothetical protein
MRMVSIWEMQRRFAVCCWAVKLVDRTAFNCHCFAISRSIIGPVCDSSPEAVRVLQGNGQVAVLAALAACNALRLAAAVSLAQQQR